MGHGKTLLIGVGEPPAASALAGQIDNPLWCARSDCKPFGKHEMAKIPLLLENALLFHPGRSGMGIVGARQPWLFTTEEPEKSLNDPTTTCYADSMIILGYFFILLLVLYAWVVLNPMTARTAVARLMRHRRRHLVQRYGQRSAARLFREFHRQALEEGADDALIEAIIHEYRPEVIERLGTQAANARLGKPRPLERTF